MTVKTTLLIAALIVVSNTASAEYEPTKKELQGWLSSNLRGCFLVHDDVKECLNIRIQFSENKLIYIRDGTLLPEGGIVTDTLNLSSSVDIKVGLDFFPDSSIVVIECDNDCLRSEEGKYVHIWSQFGMYATIPHKAAIVLKRLIEVSGGNVGSIDLDY